MLVFIRKFSRAALFLAAPSLYAATFTVTTAGDTGISTGGTTGDLRWVLNQINQSAAGTYSVSVNLPATTTITIGAALPVLNLTNPNILTFNGANLGNASTPIIIDGGSKFPGFIASQGTITLSNLSLQHVASVGGAGGVGSGGGGMGAGGALFVDAANVTVSNVTVSNSSAVGGAGGTTNGPSGGGGGGMSGGNCGTCSGSGGAGSTVTGGGGGGIGGAGGAGDAGMGGGGGGGINGGGNNAGTNPFGTGGVGGSNGLAGGGFGGANAGNGFSGGIGGASGGGGGGGGSSLLSQASLTSDVIVYGGGGGGVGGSASNSILGTGGAGGLGGGGGGSGGTGRGGAGGFGGGGGGASNTPLSSGGAGGFGGGGGGSTANVFSIGGPGGVGGFGGGGGGDGLVGLGLNTSGFGGVGGGAGILALSGGGGGGGAGFGGAVFVSSLGSLTIQGPYTTSACSTTSGLGGSSGAPGFAAGNEGFFITGAIVVLDPSIGAITLSQSIADDSPNTFMGAPMGVTPGIGFGAVITVDSTTNAAGTASLLGFNTYSGGTKLLKGILAVGTNTSLGLGSLWVNGPSTLQSAAPSLNIANPINLSNSLNVDTNGNTFTLSGAIAGAGGIVKQTGAGTLILPRANPDLHGSVIVDVGTIQIGNNLALGTGSFLFNGAGTVLQSGAPNLTVNNPISFLSDGSVDTNGNTLTLSGALTGNAHQLTKIGAGTLFLPNASTGLSAASINVGTLEVGNNASLSSGTIVFNGANTVLQAGATVALSNPFTFTTSGIINTNGFNITINSALSGTSSLTKQTGSGTLALFAASPAFSGNIFIDIGNLQVGNNQALGTGTLTMNSPNGTLQAVTTPLTLSNPIVLSANTLIDANSGVLTLSGLITGSGSLTCEGIGTLILSHAANAYSGGTIVAAGTLQIQNATALPVSGNVNVSGAGAILDLSPAGGNVTIGDLSGVSGGQVSLGANTLIFGTATASTTFDGNITGTGGITKQGSGTAIFGGTNTYTGTTAILSGTLLFSPPGVETLSGPITGPGALELQSGTLILTGASPGFTGPATVLGGTLVVNGSIPNAPLTVARGATLKGTGTVDSVSMSGTCSPGNSIGTLNTGNFTFFPLSTYNVELDNTSADLINSSGIVTIEPSSLLTLTPINLTQSLDSYTIITASSVDKVGPGFTFINSTFFDYTVGYTPTSVDLLFGGFLEFTAKGNAGKVANCFNGLIQTMPADLVELITILNLQTPEQLQHSFNQMQPAKLNAIGLAQENIAERIRQTYSRHLFAERGLPPCDKKWTTWITPFVEWDHQEGGYSENFAGFTAAVDYSFFNNWTLSGGFSFADADLHIHRTKIERLQTYAGTVAAMWTNSCLFVDALISYLNSPGRATRKMQFDAAVPGFSSTVVEKASHHFDSNEAMGHLGFCYSYPFSSTLRLNPFANIDYIYIRQEGYKEKGAHSLDLHTHGKSYDLIRPELGLGLDYTTCIKTHELNIDIQASYACEIRTLGKSTKSNFAGRECTFAVEGLSPLNHLFCPSARFTFGTFADIFSISFAYQGEYGSEFSSNAVQAEVKATF